MSSEDYQLTSDPALWQKIERLKIELSGGQSATVEMHSGLKYSGIAAGRYFGTRSATNKPPRQGGYILMDTAGGRFRLDALDIKSWQITNIQRG